MKTSLIVASATAFLLTIAPAASARGPVLPPLGAPACTGADCMLLELGDQPVAISQRAVNQSAPYDLPGGLLEQGGTYFYGAGRCTIVNLPLGPQDQRAGACRIVPGVLVSWHARRAHPWRKATPFMDATFTRYYSEEGDHPGPTADTLAYRPEMNTPDCNASGENAKMVTLLGGGFGATYDAPEDFRIACGFERALPPWASEPKPQVERPSQTGQPIATEPVEAASCRAVSIPKRRVMIRSSRVKCGTARSMMTRYLRRGIEPRGWVCVQARSGRMRTAACGKPSRARAKAVRVTARWRA